MKRIFRLAIVSMFLLSSCSFIDKIFGAKNNQSNEPKSEYEYEVLPNSFIKLTKYNGEQKVYIKVPTEYDGKKVYAIGSGCYKNNNNLTRAKTRVTTLDDIIDDEEDCSTYYIDSSINTIEEGAFDEDSSFVTDAAENKPEWEDPALNGSAEEELGNVYYDTSSEDTIVQDDIVYVYKRNLMGYFVVRCLSSEKDIVIPSVVNNINVVNVGSYSFFKNKYIEKVTLPETIGRIKEGAFRGCKNLKEVVMNCPNLGAICKYAFSSCYSLDIVRLPSNCLSINSKAFSYCGEIAEFYMPASVHTVYGDAFYHTTIKKLYYAGTEDRFNNYVVDRYNAHFFANTEIIFGGEETEFVEINTLEDIKDVENGAKVRIVSIISGFNNYFSNTGYRHIMIVNPETNFYVQCYNHKGVPFDDQFLIGRRVVVTGYKSSYYGTIEITESEFALFEDDFECIELNPVELNYSDVDFNFEDYVYKYCYLDAEIESIEESNVYFKGITSFVGYSKNAKFEDYPFMTPGSKVTIKGWTTIHNTTPEFLFDIRNAQEYFLPPDNINS